MDAQSAESTAQTQLEVIFPSTCCYSVGVYSFKLLHMIGNKLFQQQIPI